MVHVHGEVRIVDLVKMLTRTVSQTRQLIYMGKAGLGKSSTSSSTDMIMIQVLNANNRRILPGYCVLYVVSDSFSG